MTASNWQPTAVVFDMDGLLVDTNPIWREAERGLIESRGRPFSSEVRQQIMGLRMRDIVARFKEIYDLEDPLEQLRQELAQRLSQLVLEGVTPQPGAHELLAYLQQSDLPLAVASSSPPGRHRRRARNKRLGSLLPAPLQRRRRGPRQAGARRLFARR